MILVTGGSGQLAGELRHILSERQAVFVDSKVCDITRLDQIEKNILDKKISSIINCAAYTAVDLAEKEVMQAFLINEIGAMNLALLAKKYSIPLVHISTDYVFDGRSSTPLREDHDVNPMSVYGKSKLAGEQRILEIKPSGIIIRTSWLYSVSGKNFLNTIIRLANERDSLSIVCDQIGTPTNAADLALAIVEILPQVRNEICDIYHYSNEGVASWYDFSLAICELKKITCKVNPIKSCQYPTPAPRPSYSVLSKDKIKARFGTKIPYWRESLSKCL